MTVSTPASTPPRRVLRRRAGVLAALAAGAALAGGAAPAEQLAEPAGQPFVEAVEVNVVTVDVYVTDRDGRPVLGLGRGDFELFEDGRPMEITNFYAVASGAVAAPAAPPSGSPPAARSSEPETAPPAAGTPATPVSQQLHLVIYVDNQFLRPFNRNKVVDEVRRFLHRKAERGDRVMLATYEKSLHVRHPFTTDHGAVLEELEKIKTHSAFGVQARTERRDLLRRIDTSRDAFEAVTHVDFYAKSLHHDLTQSIDTLKEIVGSLAGLEGRKAVLYVSDGLPMSPAEDLFFLVDQKFSGGTTAQLNAARYRSRNAFNELTARANANRVSFYTIEAAGLTSHGSLSAEYGGRDSSTLDADVLMQQNRREPLLLMAEQTGGLATINTNNFDAAFDAIAQDFRNYYSLGYTPVHAVQGRFHRIEVRVERPGVKVRYRSGYRDKSPATRVNEGTLAALIHGAESNPLGVRVETGRGRPTAKGHYQVPLMVHVPFDSLALLPQGEVHRGSLLVSVAVVDDQGRLSPLHQQQVPIEVPDGEVAEARRHDFIYEVELLMRGGQQFVGVGVRDDFAGGASFVRRPVEIGT